MIARVRGEEMKRQKKIFKNLKKIDTQKNRGRIATNPALPFLYPLHYLTVGHQQAWHMTRC